MHNALKRTSACAAYRTYVFDGMLYDLLANPSKENTRPESLYRDTLDYKMQHLALWRKGLGAYLEAGCKITCIAKQSSGNENEIFLELINLVQVHSKNTQNRARSLRTEFWVDTFRTVYGCEEKGITLTKNKIEKYDLFFGYMWELDFTHVLKQLRLNGSVVLEIQSLFGRVCSYWLRMLREVFRVMVVVKPNSVYPMHARRFVVCVGYNPSLTRMRCSGHFESVTIRAENAFVIQERAALRDVIIMTQKLRSFFPHATRNTLRLILDAISRIQPTTHPG